MFAGFLAGIFDAIKQWLLKLWTLVNDAFWWLCYTAFEYMVNIASACFDFLPPVAKDLAADLVPMFSFAHYWLSVGDALGWVAGCWAFYAIFALVKICIKMIPTIG